jgi:hypothetical protein
VPLKILPIFKTVDSLKIKCFNIIASHKINSLLNKTEIQIYKKTVSLLLISFFFTFLVCNQILASDNA